MVEWHEGVEPELTEVMLALQEDSVGTGKTAFGKTGQWAIKDGLGQGCAAAAIRSKYMTALIQRAVGRLSIGYEFAGMGEVGGGRSPICYHNRPFCYHGILSVFCPYSVRILFF